MEGRRRHKRLKIVLAIVGAVIAVMIIAMAVYFGTYYHSVDVDEYFTDSDTVAVTETDSGWLFDGEGEDTALIFYPGAKVEASAYAPLLYELAEEGVDCFLVKMPLRMAIFGVNKALDLTEEYEYETWILAGHSLGGAMAASCAASNPDTFDVLLLLAAYTTKEIDEGITVLSLYGSEDGVLNMDSLESGRDLVPEDYTEICIEGGNHAQCGSYGEQDGDGTAAITADEQRQAVVNALLDVLDQLEGEDVTTITAYPSETTDTDEEDMDEEDPDAGISAPLLTVTCTVTDVTDGVLTLLIDNQSGYVFTYYNYITLEREENGEWAEVPFLEDAEWEDIAYELDDLKQATVKYDLYACFGELEEGTYRLTLSDISVEFSLPFTGSSDITESEAITEDEAQDIAVSDSGLSESEIKYINIWTEKEDGLWLYAVEFGTYDDTEYKYEINMYTGEIAASYIESH